MEWCARNKNFLPFGVLLVVTLLSATVLSSSISSADTEKQSDATVTVGSACTMFRESTVPHVVSVGPSSYREDVGTTRLKTVCNDTNGYAIYAIGYSNDTDGDTNMYGEEHGLTIPTGTETGDVSNWSMKLNKDLNAYNPENLTITPAFNNYAPIPSTQTKVASFEGATDTTDGSIVETTYAIRVSSDQLADTYTGQVKYTMVHPADGTAPEGPEPEPVYISTINKDTCPTTPTLVTDARDGEQYTIQKLADGNCWLLDNLRLDPATLTTTLTPENTNMDPNVSFSLPQSISENFDNYYDPQINTDYKDENDNIGNGGLTGKVGVYYNFCAASAGTLCTDAIETNASYDICPKGWRLPTGDYTGEYAALYAAYNQNSDDALNTLRVPSSGRYAFNDRDYGNMYGYFWSSTKYVSDHMYALGSGYSQFSPQSAQPARYGLSIRCIAKDAEPLDEGKFIQEMTLGSCPDTPVIVHDRRDNEAYTIQKLADGNCWMLENLRLDPATLNVTLNSSNTNMQPDNSFVLPQSGDRIEHPDVPEINATYKNDQPEVSGTKYGVYYNYCAVSAGTICTNENNVNSAAQDICPKGWRLPTGGADGEYTGVYNAYSGNSAEYMRIAKFPRAGFYDRGGRTAETQAGFHWTSTVTNGTGMSVNQSTAYDITPNISMARNLGMTVRCILRSDYVPDPEPEKIYIQDVSITTCPATPTTVYDRRDDEAYVIQKLADNNCWMLDNLRLDSATLVTTLTTENTNMDPNTSFTLPTSINSDFSAYGLPQINNSSKNTELSYGSGSGKGGVYYNYCAATAGTICDGSSDGRVSASYDICPKGWRLPTGGTDGEYSALRDIYQSGDLRNTFRIVRAGYIYYSTIGRVNDAGQYWTSSPVPYDNDPYGTSTYIQDMYMYDDRVYFNPGRLNRNYGISVRCIAKNANDIEPEPIHDIQNVTPATCPTEPTTVYDSRDGEMYTIQKLADGKCWMLDNLRLGRITLKVLTPDDTNIRQNFTLPASIPSGFDSFVDPRINIDSKNDIAEGSDGKIGVYYNYCAATAGTFCQAEGSSTGTPSEDICPKGWRLPTGGDDGEYQTLFAQYDTYAEFKTALRTPLSGYFKGSGTNHQGSYGSFWSSTPVGNDKIYSLDVRAGSVPNDFTSNRDVGISIRCVAYEPTALNIQDITPDTCPTTPTNVYDTRDNSVYTIQKLADGNCWMLDNLRLGRSTMKVLTPDDTNISSTFILPGSIGTGFDEYELPQINIDSKNKVTSFGDGDNKIGVYYNFCAATAGTYCDPEGEGEGQPEEDICPKGWRLPTGGEEGEYQALFAEYDDYADFKNALRASLSGYFKNSSKNHQGSYGSFWSSTPVGDDRIYSLDVRPGSVPDDFTSYRNVGISIRCVAAKPKVPRYIQDVTADICPTTPTTVYDKRDGEAYTIQKLADGKCWLLENLRLDPATLLEPLTSANTNLSSGRTYTMPASISTGFRNLSAAQLNTDSKNNLVDYGSGAGQGKVGVYYNYCAASAGTVCYSSSNASQDLCPAGWRMPTGGSSGEYNNLYQLYGSDILDFGDALRMTYSGYYYNSGTGDYGIKGRAWSITNHHAGNQHDLCYEYENGVHKINTADTNGHDIGMSIRCVAK